jgi:hypothetical protein
MQENHARDGFYSYIRCLLMAENGDRSHRWSDQQADGTPFFTPIRRIRGPDG